ncbi:unnamed protein product [Symbiodinium natans]|uniref:Pentatricopeptide repeat-containing protein n=1 Tax=Symbiodinium natans TaxID=878477 RepID=A0A812NHA8_9DINO|nr:unnamed protein product [Symbiodinium natans]
MPMLCEQVIEDMVSAGVQPSNYSASILIKLYGRISDLNAAFKVLDEMPRKFGFRPNAAATLTWTVPVREQDATAAATAPIFRLCQVYTTLMSSCTWRLGKGINMADLQITTSAPLRNGRMDLAMTLLERMHQDGQTPDEKTYATLLRGVRTSDCHPLMEYCSFLNWHPCEARHVM